MCEPTLSADPPAPRYARHAPGYTLLYALVAAHYPDFIACLQAAGRSLPEPVREEFDDYLSCGVLDHGFERVLHRGSGQPREPAGGDGDSGGRREDHRPRPHPAPSFLCILA